MSERPFSPRHQQSAIPKSPDYWYDPCRDGHSDDEYFRETFPGLGFIACRRCGNELKRVRIRDDGTT